MEFARAMGLSWLDQRSMDGRTKVPRMEEDMDVVEAEDELDLEEIRRFNLCLIGKLWTDSSFNLGALQPTIKQIWRVKMELK